MESKKKTFTYGSQTVTFETGEVARQTDGAVLVSIGDTVVLVTVVGKKDSDGARDFFPLTVNYQEKAYSAGRIPGGFFKREGRPGEKETLTCRLIDRPIRPLFADGFKCDVQVVATVMSVDPSYDPDIAALLGTSAALAVSGLPFNGPIGAARVGYINNEYVLNPSFEQLAESKLDLVVAGTESAVLMVESEADQLSEEIMLGAVTFGHEQQQAAIQAVKEFAAEAANPSWDWKPAEKNVELYAKVESLAKSKLENAYRIKDKVARKDEIGYSLNDVLDELCVNEDDPSEQEVTELFHSVEKKIVRSWILEGQPRIDGRDTRTVRPIYVKTGILPRTHGSALFTRGETQAIVTTTLGTAKDAQIIDALEGERRDPFMLHYNFPPFCVGETGMIGSPKRREIGHGRLAKRGIAAVLPSETDYPYVLRVVSEITESNGSSSMASVCGTSLALMDAGVPVKAPVAGIAMGLIKEDEKFAVLSDILGDEDHLGDMDFKVAGTDGGITALQMDIKIDGITKEIMQVALDQAKEGRIHILGKMNEVISQPKEMSEHAPRIISINIHPEKIRDVIGKGGATIRSITEETGASIDISDDGLVKIYSVDADGGEEAKKRIELITAEVEVGVVYEGRVNKLMDFGAFVTVLPGRDGLLHISQISHERVEKVSDKLTEGDVVKVKVLEVDKQGRMRLSMKALEEKPEPVEAASTED